MNLQGKSFLKLLDFTPAEIEGLLNLSARLKAEKKAGQPHPLCQGKNIALLFEKTSTRTRCAFEVAARDLGMGVTYLDPAGSQMGAKESVADTARVLGRMYDGIEYRGFAQSTVEQLAEYAGVPVWNGLTDEFHPTQILADMLTIREHFGKLKGIKMVYFGDARFNMGNSLLVGCAKLGVDFTACAPKAYFPSQELIDQCQQLAAVSGAKLTFTESVEEAAAGDLHRHLGIHGRARRGLAAAHQRPAALPGEQKGDGTGRSPGDLHALPARLPRHEHRHRPEDRPDLWAQRRPGGHRRGVREQPVGGV